MSWTWFYALYSIASVFFIIGLLWKVAIIPLTAISLIFNEAFHRIAIFIILLIPNYFFASYAVLTGLYLGGSQKSVLILTLNGLFLFLYILLGVAQAQRELEKDYDYASMWMIRFRYYGLFMSLAYYIYSIFDPRLAINSSTTWIAGIITWVQRIPILNIVIAICAFLYVVYIIYMALLMIVMGILVKSQKTSPM